MTRQKLKFALKEQENQNRPRLLIADDDTTLARATSEYFTSKGFNCRICYTVASAREILEFWHPQFILIDLMLPHSNALALFKFINAKPIRERPRVVLLSRQPLTSGLDTIKKLGAAGILNKPFTFAEAHQLLDPSVIPHKEKPAVEAAFSTKVERQSAPKRESIVLPVQEAAKVPSGALPADLDPVTKEVLKELHLVNLFLKQAMDQRRPTQNLFHLMQMLSLKLKALRCSFVRCLNQETGIVMASNDDSSVSGLPIQLNQYPEIQESMRTLQAVLIPSVRASELMAPVRDVLTRHRFETIAVFPIFVQGKFFGVTSLRMEQRQPHDMFYIDRFGQVAAQIISLTLAA